MASISQELLKRENEVRQYIEKYADLFDLDPNLIRGLITQESRFIAEATSPTGAYGYGQFTSIGARQVQNISAMTEKAANLSTFTKQDADNPDLGIKAICATLWWLFQRKYRQVGDKKIQLEAVLTFYNSGGRPAALVIKHEGHENAVGAIHALPRNMRSQAVKYAPEVAVWFVSWHEHMATEIAAKPAPQTGSNPFDDEQAVPAQYMALIEALRIFAGKDGDIDIIINSREGVTEVSLLFPGELV